MAIPKRKEIVKGKLIDGNIKYSGNHKSTSWAEKVAMSYLIGKEMGLMMEGAIFDVRKLFKHPVKKTNLWPELEKIK